MRYEYECRLCGFTFELDLKVAERDDPCADPCPVCDPEVPSVIRLVGNRGGFRLSPHGTVGWASDGYASTLGDAEVFHAREEGRKPDVY